MQSQKNNNIYLIFCYIINISFDQYNAFLVLKVSISLKKKTDPTERYMY